MWWGCRGWISFSIHTTYVVGGRHVVLGVYCLVHIFVVCVERDNFMDVSFFDQIPRRWCHYYPPPLCFSVQKYIDFTYNISWYNIDGVTTMSAHFTYVFNRFRFELTFFLLRITDREHTTKYSCCYCHSPCHNHCYRYSLYSSCRCKHLRPICSGVPDTRTINTYQV